VTKGATSQEDWSAVVVADPVQETELLPVWEIEMRPDDGGWNEDGIPPSLRGSVDVL